MTRWSLVAFVLLLFTAFFVSPLFAQEKLTKEPPTAEKYLESLVGGDIVEILPDKSWTGQKTVRVVLIVMKDKQKVAYTLESTFDDEGGLVDARILDETKGMGGIPVVSERIPSDRLYKCGYCCRKNTSDPFSYGWCYWTCVALGVC